MAKIQIKNSFITSSAQITISSSLVRFSDGISAKNITGSFSGSIPQLSSYFKQAGNSFGTTAILGTNDNQPLAFEINNSERVRIDTSGNLLVGTTTSPSNTGLSVGSTGTVSQILGGMQNTCWRIRERDVIDALAITTNINDAGTQDSSARSSWKLRMGWGNGQDNFVIARSPVATNSFSDLFYINSTGNVGIGTTSPNAKLQTTGHIVGGLPDSNTPVSATTLSGFTGLGSFNSSSLAVNIDALYLRKGTTNGGSIGISFGSAGGDSYFVGARIKHLRSGTNSQGHLVFETKNDSSTNTTVERMRITDAGNVGIGSSTPAYKLDVAGDVYSSNYYSVLTAASYGPSDASATMQVFGSTGSGGLTNTIKFVTGGSERVRITSGGYVGIGTSTTTSGLQIQTEGTNTTSGSFLFVRSINASFGGGAIGVGYDYAAAVGNNFYPFRIRAGSTNAIFTINSVGVVYAGDTTGAIPYGNHDPYYTFNQDTNTGMDWAAADTLTFKTGGSERMRITSGGNIGIGQSSPASKLHILGSSFITSSANTSNVKFEGGGGNGLAFGTIDATSTYASWIQSGYVSNFVLATYNLLLQPLGGNVGIGTSSPGYKLDVVSGSMRVSSAARAGEIYFGTDSNAYIYLKRDNDYDLTLAQDASSGNALYLAGAGNVYLSIDSNNNETDRAFIVQNNAIKAGTELFRVQENGNVGIGTSSPSGKLEVRTNAASTYVFSGTSTSGYTTSFTMDDTASYIGHDSSIRSLILRTNSISRLTVKGDGNVGIGRTSPQQKLHIAGTNARLAISNDSDNNWAEIGNDGSSGQNTLEFFTGTSVTSAMSITNANNVGIGTSSPVAALDVSRLEYPSLGGVLANFSAGTTDPTTEKYVILKQTYTGAAYDSPMLVFKANANSANSGSFGIVRTTSNGSIVFSNVNATSGTVTAVSEKMRIASDGNVGIGTTSPSQALHILTSNSGNNGLTIATTSATGNPQIRFLNSAGVEKAAITYASSADTVYFYTAGSASNLMNFVGANVGIGTTSPTRKLDVNGDGYFASTLYIADNTAVNFGNTSQIYHNSARAATQFTGTSGGDTMCIKDSSGFVGIGTTNPATRLEVYGVVRVSESSSGGILQLTAGASAIDIASTFYGGSRRPITFTMDGEKVRIASDGNVGIGTTSPATILQVVGTGVGSVGTINIKGASAHLGLTNAAGTFKGWYGYYNSTTHGSDNDLNIKTGYAGTSNIRFSTDGDTTAAMLYIKSDGNVGIGTSSPNSRLQIVSGSVSPTLLLGRANGYSSIKAGATSNGGYLALDSDGTASGALILNHYVSDNVWLVTGGGKVGIGLTNPNTKLQVSGSATIGGYNAFYSGTGVTSLSITAPLYPVLAFYYGTTLAGTVGGYSDHMSIYAPASKYITFEPGDSEKMRITATGAFLVGNTSAPNPGAATTVSGFAINGSGNDAYISHKIDNGPCAYFRRDGTDGFVLAFYKANSSVGTISVTTTATAYNTTSDYRLKESIKPLNSGLTRVNALKPSVYNWKSDGSNGEGFLAHELAEVVPLAVTGQKDAVNDDGSINPQSVDLSKVVPILVAAIQELTARIKILESR